MRKKRCWSSNLVLRLSSRQLSGTFSGFPQGFSEQGSVPTAFNILHVSLQYQLHYLRGPVELDDNYARTQGST